MISLLTALAIQANGAEVGTYGPAKGGKYGFHIYSIIEEKYRSQLFSQADFESEENAEKKGKELLEEIMSLDLNPKRKELSYMLGEAGSIIQKTVDGSKK